MALHPPIDSTSIKAWRPRPEQRMRFRHPAAQPDVTVMLLRGGPVWFDRADEELVTRYWWRRNTHGVVEGRRRVWAVVDLDADDRLAYRELEIVTLGGLLLKPARGRRVISLNGDRRDFRRANLQAVPASIASGDSRRMAPPKPGLYKGVYRCTPNGDGKQRYWARIGHRFLGCYETPEDAARAYDAAARERWPGGCFLNFPEA